MEEDLLPSSEASRAPAPDPEEGLSTPAAGPDTYIGPTSSMRSLATLSAEHVRLQSHHEQVLSRGLVCMCDELQSCCEHAASALTVHPRVQTLLLTRPSALLQTGSTSEWMCEKFTGSLARRLAHDDASLTGPAMSHEGDCGAQQYQATR